MTKFGSYHFKKWSPSKQGTNMETKFNCIKIHQFSSIYCFLRSFLPNWSEKRRRKEETHTCWFEQVRHRRRWQRCHRVLQAHTPLLASSVHAILQSPSPPFPQSVAIYLQSSHLRRRLKPTSWRKKMMTKIRLYPQRVHILTILGKAFEPLYGRWALETQKGFTVKFPKNDSSARRWEPLIFWGRVKNQRLKFE